jgi:hypothetical protein
LTDLRVPERARPHIHTPQRDTTRPTHQRGHHQTPYTASMSAALVHLEKTGLPNENPLAAPPASPPHLGRLYLGSRMEPTLAPPSGSVIYIQTYLIKTSVPKHSPFSRNCAPNECVLMGSHALPDTRLCPRQRRVRGDGQPPTPRHTHVSTSTASAW